MAGIADSVDEALAIATEHKPSLALVDVNLGEGGDGVELARRLRAEHGTRVIFLTGSADPQTLARLSAVEGHGYLQKPFIAAELARTIRDVLAPA